MKKVEMIFDWLSHLIEEKFTGSIEIHFTQGGLAKVIKHEQIK